MKTATPAEFIAKKRDGEVLSEEQIRDFVQGVTAGAASDAQIAALAMAIVWRGMTREETVALTLAMRDSGTTLRWDDLDGPVVDKHSTGGVGDTVSLIVGPLAAALGCYVPMISGRGLGHTGGTLDKLESIPGYNACPSVEVFQRVVKGCGVAIVGQTTDLAPADRRIYAVRDVTATVESLPLIVASILSKKLAAGIGFLLMDVKTGNGAFLPDRADAEKLAATIVEVSGAAGTPARAVITDMGQPLATCAGNALEVAEAVGILKGDIGAGRLRALSLDLTARMTGKSEEETERALTSGAAAERFAQMLAALGGPLDFMENSARLLPHAPEKTSIKARSAGFVTRIQTRALGWEVVRMGGGRFQSEDKIDPATGFSHFVSIGQWVEAGEELCRVHGQRPLDSETAGRIRDFFMLAPTMDTRAPG